MWIGAPKVTVQISGTGTTSPFGSTELRLSIQVGTRSTSGRAAGEVIEPGLELEHRILGQVAHAFGEDDQARPLVERGDHQRHRVFLRVAARRGRG